MNLAPYLGKLLGIFCNVTEWGRALFIYPYGLHTYFLIPGLKRHGNTTAQILQAVFSAELSATIHVANTNA
jgi:hypothetical protein